MKHRSISPRTQITVCRKVARSLCLPLGEKDFMDIISRARRHCEGVVKHPLIDKPWHRLFLARSFAYLFVDFYAKRILEKYRKANKRAPDMAQNTIASIILPLGKGKGVMAMRRFLNPALWNLSDVPASRRELIFFYVAKIMERQDIAMTKNGYPVNKWCRYEYTGKKSDWPLRCMRTKRTA